ncbi:MAG: PBP1A family penicillin-binding protein [SAR324 cluster bacterium]|nr:PBP1A family penicillin-binding protein [SAR324 cluster bacterium]
MARHVTRWIGITGLTAAVAAFALVVSVLVYLNSTLPPVERLEHPEFALPTTIYDRNGKKVQEIFIKRRKLVGYKQLPHHLINGLIAKEDARFFEHRGIDPLRMLKAAWVNLLAMKTAQGASTLTQQTARQFFLSLKKTWTRKLKEILLALEIEREFTKEEILTLYLNKVNFGDAWGVAAAAEYYFSKPVEELSLSESAVLVGLLPAPNRYKPTRNPHLARQQRDIVLLRMAEEGFITRTQQMAAASEPIILAERKDPTIAAVAYYVEYVRRILLKKYGSKNLYEGGLSVYTAMDLNYQLAAHRALNNGVRNLDMRRGYRRSTEKLELDQFKQVPDEVLENLNAPHAVELGQVVKGVVVDVNAEEARIALGLTLEGVIPWELLSEQWRVQLKLNAKEEQVPVLINDLASILAPGELVLVKPTWRDPESGEFTLDLYQEPQSNGALYAMDPDTGEVLAMVGGTRFGRGDGASEFIRATQAERQPGSSFKPIIYAAAIDEGYTPASILQDSPRVFTLRSGRKHIPRNYDKKYLGNTTLREALMRSRNVPTVQLVEEMGARKVIEYARKFGLSTAIPEESIIALGTHSVKLDELTRAYSVFAGKGNLAEQIYILRIENAQGEVLEKAEFKQIKVISDATAYLVGDILQDVVRRPLGTGYRAISEFNRPAAGKTGTTQNYTDAWYLGYIPQLVAGVYVGFDDASKSLGPSETGSRAAAPIWLEFMQAVERSMAVETFRQPPTVVAHRVSAAGKLLGPCDTSEDSRLEFFKVSSIPPRFLSSNGCGRTVAPNYRKRRNGDRQSSVKLPREDESL